MSRFLLPGFARRSHTPLLGRLSIDGFPVSAQIPWAFVRARIGSHLPPLIGIIVLISVLIQLSPHAVLYAGNSGSDEIVAFNTKSLKYHCLECTWAKKCTVNCVNVAKSEAIRRGGVPCKICGGTCRQAQHAAQERDAELHAAPVGGRRAQR